MADLEKQIRLRVTDQEKVHIETATKEAGYKKLSDYLRHVLFDQHVLIVPPEGEFILIPAAAANAEEKESAELNIAGLIQLARGVAVEEIEQPVPEPFPVDEVFPAPDPAEQLPVENFTEAWPNPVEQPAFEIPHRPIAVPPIAPPALALGPRPLPEETADLFMARRIGELQREGSSPLSSQMVAEAEWKAALPPTPQAPSPAAEQAPAAAVSPTTGMPFERPRDDNGRGFCGDCGTALQGTRFCARCGSPA